MRRAGAEAAPSRAHAPCRRAPNRPPSYLKSLVRNPRGGATAEAAPWSGRCPCTAADHPGGAMRQTYCMHGYAVASDAPLGLRPAPAGALVDLDLALEAERPVP